MKFEVGEVTEFQGYIKRKQTRISGPSRSRPSTVDLFLEKTLGMILSCHEPSELFGSHKFSPDQSNGYIWRSYINGIEYLVYEDEMITTHIKHEM